MFHIHLYHWLDTFPTQISVIVPGASSIELGPNPCDPGTLGPELVGKRLSDLAPVAVIVVRHFGLESRCTIHEIPNVVESPADPRERSVYCTAGVSATIQGTIPVGSSQQCSFPGPADSECYVDVRNAAVRILKAALSIAGTNIGMRWQIAGQAKHIEIRVLARYWVRRWHRLTGRAVIRDECTNRIVV